MSVFRIDVLKTIQAICLLLKAMRKDRLEYISILKLLYMADRESSPPGFHPGLPDGSSYGLEIAR